MKKISLIAMIAVAMLFTTGCTKKPKPVDPNAGKKEPVKVVEDTVTDTVQKLSLSDLQNLVKVVYFDFNKYNIREDMSGVVSENANVLAKDEAKGVSVVVSGHCDEWGTDEYNMALGQKRALAVKDALVNLGVSAANITTVSKGEGEPVCTEKNEGCWSKNRRAEILLGQ